MSPHSHFGPDDDLEQRKRMEGFMKEMAGESPRKWPQGRISGDDDGQTHIAIAADPILKIVRVQFTKPIDWLGLGAAEARDLAKMLLEKADQISAA